MALPIKCSDMHTISCIICKKHRYKQLTDIVERVLSLVRPLGISAQPRESRLFSYLMLLGDFPTKTVDDSALSVDGRSKTGDNGAL